MGIFPVRMEILELPKRQYRRNTMQGKVEICGVNTARLKTLTPEQMDALLQRSKEGDEEARTAGMDSRTLTDMAIAFCDTIIQAGYQPMIYFNQYIAYLRYDLAVLSQYPFWFAHFADAPVFYYDYAMWQYSESGRVNGISGNVDMNLRMEPI